MDNTYLKQTRRQTSRRVYQTQEYQNLAYQSEAYQNTKGVLAEPSLAESLLAEPLLAEPCVAKPLAFGRIDRPGPAELAPHCQPRQSYDLLIEPFDRELSWHLTAMTRGLKIFFFLDCWMLVFILNFFARRGPRGALLRGAKPRRGGDALGARATKGGDRVEEH